MFRFMVSCVILSCYDTTLFTSFFPGSHADRFCNVVGYKILRIIITPSIVWEMMHVENNRNGAGASP
jgi:hypothetical protein